MKLIIFCFLLAVLAPDVAWGLKCYICTQSGASDADACLKNPESLGDGVRYTCKKKFCTIFRQDLKDPPTMASFARGCEDAPVFLNKNVEDETYKTYYRACKKSLCNNGTGVDTIVGNGFGKDIGPSGLLLVPGTGERNSAISPAHSVLSGTLLPFIAMKVLRPFVL